MVSKDPHSSGGPLLCRNLNFFFVCNFFIVESLSRNQVGTSMKCVNKCMDNKISVDNNFNRL